MTNEFESECDRLSRAVDSGHFERIRWARTEGPMLERLSELARGTVAERPDFELTEEGSSSACKRFVLKVHGFRIVAINVGLDGHTVSVWAEDIERSKYKVMNGRRRQAEYSDVDETWMIGAVSGVISEVA